MGIIRNQKNEFINNRQRKAEKRLFFCGEIKGVNYLQEEIDKSMKNIK